MDLVLCPDPTSSSREEKGLVNWAIQVNNSTPPMDDQQGKFNPWTQLNGNQPPWTALN